MGAAARVVVLVRNGVGGRERRGHEGEDEVQGGAAEEGEAVDVAEVDFAGEEQEGAEEEEEEDRAREVGVVHYVLVDAREGVEHCECLFSSHVSTSFSKRAVLELYAEFYILMMHGATQV